MSKLANIHDAFFKQVLSDPGLAGKFLREHLPPDVADLLGPDPPEPIPGSFVDEELRQHHSDLLFRIQLKAGYDAFAYVLMEHKSSPDRKECIMGWLTQPYYDKGKAEGEAAGEAKILTRLLEKRFGVVPASLRQRIVAAEVSEIESWVERAFDAPDLQSVFEANPITAFQPA